jgi:hypothetical protein
MNTYVEIDQFFFEFLQTDNFLILNNYQEKEISRSLMSCLNICQS